MIKRTWLSILLALVVISSVLVACGPGGESTQTPASGGAKPEGSLVAGVTSLGEEGLLPNRGGDTQALIWENVYDYLIYVEEKTMKMIPGLAERWETSPDARTVTLWLRKGIMWPEAYGEVTADDVKYTFERLAEQGSSSQRAAQLRVIEKTEVDGPYKVIITLKDPNPVWWQFLNCNVSPYLPVISKKFVEAVGDDAANQKSIGSGPYRIIEQKRGSYVKFEAVEKHWRVVPEFKNLTLNIVPEESTRVAMLKTGEIDVTDVTAMKAAELKAAGISVATPGFGGGVLSYSFGGLIIPDDKSYKADYHQKDPWTDIRVREAMSIAIDRDAINKAIFFGAAQPVAVPYIVPGWDKVKPITFDAKRAKELLKAAGYANGFNLELYSWARPGTPEIPSVTEAISGYWAEIGVKAKIVPLDLATFKPRMASRQTAGAIWPNRWSTSTEQSNQILTYHLPDSAQPVFEDAQFTPLGRQLLAELDFAKRNALWLDVMNYIRDNYLMMPVLAIQNNYAWNPKKVSEWPHGSTPYPQYWQYIKHAKPLNTFRLFTP